MKKEMSFLFAAVPMFSGQSAGSGPDFIREMGQAGGAVSDCGADMVQTMFYGVDAPETYLRLSLLHK
ncbi:MAG: hypothetical protein K2O45_11045 [Oscillospiraceae bacterium]|nr:hypothetical protein [Oscillospiraceae bacterium]